MTEYRKCESHTNSAVTCDKISLRDALNVSGTRHHVVLFEDEASANDFFGSGKSLVMTTVVLYPGTYVYYIVLIDGIQYEFSDLFEAISKYNE